MWVSWPASESNSARLSALSPLSSTTRICSRDGGGARSGRARRGRAATSRSVAGERQRDDELAAAAEPGALAATLPPCISTSRRTSVRPMPRPPRERSSEWSTWANISNTLPISVGVDADAVVAAP